MLYQLSDLHLFDDPQASYRGANVQANLDRCLAYLKDRLTAEDTLIVTGDLCQHDNETAYMRLAQQLSQLTAQVAWIPGNHDATEPMLAAGEAFGIVTQANAELVVDEHWRVILLHTNDLPDGRGGSGIKPCHLAKLQAQLASPSPLHTLIALHHPFLPVGCPWQDDMMLSNAEALLSCLEQTDQPIKLIAGHVHGYHRIEHKHLELITSPATSVQFDPNSDTLAVREQGPLALPGVMAYQLDSLGGWQPQYIAIDEGAQGWPQPLGLL